ncbi:MAG: aminotransferase class I/II-fold pyridoxal phosphate-dependent enzyme [Campylobacterota bacterium]|nr:aminotransferase class I/II-fold pyridoxal phosphate-dependent enzyme [Campylobacterota bacterium]
MLEFSHGGDVNGFAKQLGCCVSEVIDLSSNINFLKPNIAVNFNALSIDSYPNYDKLYDAVAQNYAIQASQMELFNGGSSAIFSLFSFLKTKGYERCTIYSPAYLEYKKAAQTFDYHLKHINRLESIGQMVLPNSLVVFVNPSTPDGALYELEDFLDEWLEKKCVVLIDESFLDFTNAKSATQFLDQYPNIFILKSLTKFYSSAGIRVGAMISNKSNIEQFQAIQPAWKISQFDSSYIQEALKDTKFKTITKAVNAKNTLLLNNVLEESLLFEKVFTTSANYILAKLKNIDAQTLQKYLSHHKIMIRDCTNFDGLDETYVRIAVKSEQSIKRFKKALQRVAQKSIS